MTRVLSLSCANCSAPLEVSEGVSQLTCAFCGTPQLVERGGGAVSLRRVEATLEAVQRSADRTAAELAIPRLLRERQELQQKRAVALAAEQERHVRARSRRSGRAWIAFFATLLLGGLVQRSLAEVPVFSDLFSIAWMLLLIGAPWFVWRTTEMPRGGTPKDVAEFDAKLMRVEQHIAANRSLLDRLPN